MYFLKLGAKPRKNPKKRDRRQLGISYTDYKHQALDRTMFDVGARNQSKAQGEDKRRKLNE